MNMKGRYRLFRRAGGTYYAEDTETKKQTSLGTKDKQEAKRLLHAKNESHRQPQLNFQIGQVYLCASDPHMATRDWDWVFNQAIQSKTGPTRRRWENAHKDKALATLMMKSLIATRPEHLMEAMQAGTVSTNVYLRRVHNLALDMMWLPRPIILRRQWPKVKHRETRAITLEEHQRILAAEGNPERKAFYWMCWHLGGGQTDMASLKAEDFDLESQTVTYWRQKTGQKCQMRFGEEVLVLLKSLPEAGPLFPYLKTVREADRATEFRQRCQQLGIRGVTLHSYRYSWAQRAKACGYPKRFAQLALGHGSKAVARAYARASEICLPCLNEYNAGPRT